jgi:hypothetical protein
VSLRIAPPRRLVRPAGLLATSLALGAAAAGSAPPGGVNVFKAHHMLLWPEHAAPAFASPDVDARVRALGDAAARQYRRVILPLSPGMRTATAARRLAAVFHRLAETFALQPLEWAGRAQAAAAVLGKAGRQVREEEQDRELLLLNLAPCVADSSAQIKAVQTVDFSERAAIVELCWFELRRDDSGVAPSLDSEWVPAWPDSRRVHDFSRAWLEAVRAFGSVQARGSEGMWSECDVAIAEAVSDSSSNAAAVLYIGGADSDMDDDCDAGRDGNDDQGEDDLRGMRAQFEDAEITTTLALPYRTGLRKRRLSGLSILSEDSDCSFEPLPLEELFRAGELPQVATQRPGRQSRQRGSPLHEGCFVRRKAARSDLDRDCHGPFLPRAAALVELELSH